MGDLIQYASESMDGVCDLATKAKSTVLTSKEETKQLVQSRVCETKDLFKSTAAETQTKLTSLIEPHKAALESRLQRVYTYAEGKWVLAKESEQYAALNSAYNNAI